MKAPWGRIRDPLVAAAVYGCGLLAVVGLALWLIGSLPPLTPSRQVGMVEGQSMPAWWSQVGSSAPKASQTPTEMFSQGLISRGLAAPEAIAALCSGKVKEPDAAFRRFRKAVIADYPSPLCSTPQRIMARAPLAVAFGAGLGSVFTVLILAVLCLVGLQLGAWLWTDGRRWWLFDRAVSK